METNVLKLPSAVSFRYMLIFGMRHRMNVQGVFFLLD
jgi:hypothetical protein